MTWICPKCNEELGDYNGWCEYCYVKDNTKVYNPDRYYIREVRIRHICVERSETMTPQEELFAELFNHEKILVKDMDTLVLRAHREELAKIAFEARVRLTAVDDEDRTRKKSDRTKPQGFERSLNIDEVSTDAINAVKDRQKRLTKSEKIQAGLESMFIKAGMSLADAQKDAAKLMGAGNILQRLKDKADKSSVEGVSKDDSVEVVKAFNPFEKK